MSHFNRFNPFVMQLSEESIVEYKEIYKKEFGKEPSDSDARDQARRLVGLFELLFKCAQEDSARERRLKKEPDGFPVDSQYSCLVCGNSINPETGWYHWGGPRCLLCHKAIMSGAIPSFVLKHRDSFFRTWYLADAFKVRTVTIRKMVREGKLKAREILSENGKVHEYIFLKKENPELVERHSPARKSWDRNRNKMSDAHIREERKKAREEMQKERAKWKKKFNRSKNP